MKDNGLTLIFSVLLLVCLLTACVSSKVVSEPVVDSNAEASVEEELEPLIEHEMKTESAQETESELAGITRPPIDIDGPLSEGEKALGVKIQAIRSSAAGYMLDLRFYVFDSTKAQPLADKKVHPYLIHQKTGTYLGIPAPAKIGSLRQKPRSYYPNRSYFMLFANPAGLVKPGDLVDVVAGDYSFKSLTVE